MKKFDVPEFYRSSIIASIKEKRRNLDPKKKDFTPSIVDFGSVKFHLARHFGFCYGVENAIEISYKAIEENPDKNIYLLSQMIHNPIVNDDLISRGLRFIMDTDGNQLIDWDEINSDDVVITPAFGTTIEIKKLLEDKNIKLEKYDTTCPFVTRVWKKASSIGTNDFSIIIHGKHKHEETKATFSHSMQNAPSLIIKDLNEAKQLVDFIEGKLPEDDFYVVFKGKYSKGFDLKKDLQKIGVVNQTTMLASETEEISNFLKDFIINKHGEDNYKDYFADTRDTLCYATNENQKATYGLLNVPADIAIVVGGYNSSNTSHLVELCEHKLPTYFIKSYKEILSRDTIRHFKYEEKEIVETNNFLPNKKNVKIILTSGASCPDSEVDKVLNKLLTFFEDTNPIEEVLNDFSSK
ncbi:4-hydroxy-3-methylbut-2-enyl diphosphate reductase [Flavobacteriales bacterium]|jgi:4-hydroxy-3-methylbut-2-en-1-yl diphosphate reductase|nr:4-hydroxy-3-methylbut-2-enyl diphosphate reductase [Flavobacteriales bacterium]